MSIALFALAAVMIVGGIVSVIQGFPFVRLESGLAMTIAGATTASAGAVVLGLAVVARRLRGLERSLLAARDTRTETDAAGLEPEASLRQRPNLAATAASLGGVAGAGLAGGALAGAGLASGALAGGALGGATRAGREPSFFDPAPPAPEASAAEPLLPNLLPESEAPAPQPAPSAPVFVADAAPPSEEEMLFAAHEPQAHHLPDAPQAETPHAAEAPPEPAVVIAEAEPLPEPKSEPEPEPMALRPALIETAEFTELPPEPVPPVAPVEPEPQVVGTYASGGNTYVMYSTGVIEADTPRGRYTFASLDELKAFVEAGGENDARGAA
ncbi:hypothetical protein [Methylobacterium sp.]|uniref:hypothetical protein n=1 Tax=Methylobacterium sp. TaxID=409 RepID=UPI00262C40FE|nr:hypothetical protein [Methylobacterium sp.]MDB5647958.1 hypothetical protein [Methylobacterium sp.]